MLTVGVEPMEGRSDDDDECADPPTMTPEPVAGVNCVEIMALEGGGVTAAPPKGFHTNCADMRLLW